MDGVSLSPVLTDAQTAAAHAAARRVLVVAAAGSGKTRVLVERIRHFVQEKHYSPSDILAITFTRKAAREMELRLLEVLPEAMVKKMTIGTIHAFASRVLRWWAPKVGRSTRFSIYDVQDRDEIRLEIAEDMGFPHKAVKWWDALDDGPRAKIETEYARRLEMYDAFDFDGLVTGLSTVMPDDEVRGQAAARWRHVLVDEFQDTDRVQVTVLHTMGAERLFCVGDDWQAIYGWRGAEVKNMVEMYKDPIVETHELEVNFRSLWPIVAASNAVIRHNKGQIQKNVTTVRPGSEGAISYAALDVAPIAFIPEAAMGGTVGVLCRKHRPLAKLSSVLTRNLISHVYHNPQGDPWTAIEFRRIVARLRLALNPNDDHSCWRVIRDCMGIVEQQHLRVKATSEGTHLWYQLLSYGITRAVGHPTREAVESVIELIEVPPETIGALQERFAWARCRQFQAWTTAYGDHSLQEFLDWYATRAIQDVDFEAAQVKLMTIHAAKGLEFDTVFLIDVPERKNLTEQQMEEERRVFYVGMTRARNRLVFLRDQAVPASTFIQEATGEADTLFSETDGQR